jgi:hypothetical protein
MLQSGFDQIAFSFCLLCIQSGLQGRKFFFTFNFFLFLIDSFLLPRDLIPDFCNGFFTRFC